MGHEQASARTELPQATDEQIDDAVTYADPMALRGLLYQLTGDERIAATKVGSVPGYVGGNLSIGLTDPADVALLRAKAAQFLKSYRASGAGVIVAWKSTPDLIDAAPIAAIAREATAATLNALLNPLENDCPAFAPAFSASRWRRLHGCLCSYPPQLLTNRRGA